MGRRARERRRQKRRGKRKRVADALAAERRHHLTFVIPPGARVGGFAEAFKEDDPRPILDKPRIFPEDTHGRNNRPNR